MLRRPLRLVAAVSVAVLLAGCGAAGEANPRKIGPQGVDELVIPTPSPDPGDFVQAVDNPWLPLAPGTVWTYDVSGGVVRHLEVRVEKERKTVAGVSCVVVSWRTTDRDDVPVAEGRAFYAQDRRGNVWLFGEDSARRSTGAPASPSWHAGESGAEAGIAMLASPRVGDGYLRELSGNTSDRATVLSVDEERTVPAGTFGGLVLTEDESVLPHQPRVVRRYYAQGVGLVEQTTTAGGTEQTVLESVVTP
jgi:hypothetical protein